LPASDLTVSIFDLRGRKVATVVEGQMATEAGLVNLDWDLLDASGRPVGSGVYFVRALSPSAGLQLERKVVVIP